jgi:hypothetical protein
LKRSTNEEAMKPRYVILITVVALLAVMLQVYSHGRANRAGQLAFQRPYSFSDVATIPSAVTLDVSPVLTRTWEASTTDPRALQKLNSSDRIAAAYYSPTWFEIDLNITDGQVHQIALYCLDWDSNARAQTIEARDYTTGALLYSRSISSFHDGQYLVLNVAGHVVFRVTRTAGADAVVSGIYFGGPKVTPTPTPTPCEKLPNGKCRKRSKVIGALLLPDYARWLVWAEFE